LHYVGHQSKLAFLCFELHGAGSEGERRIKMAKKKAPVWKKFLPPDDGEFINSVAISGNGKVVVAGTYFYNTSSVPVQMTVGMFAYDNNGNPIWPGPDTYSATCGSSSKGGINSVAVSRNGAWAASGGGSGSVGLINAYNVASGSKSLVCNTPANVTMVALNGDGSFLAAGGDMLRVFQRSGSTSMWSAPQSLSYPNAGVERVAISADGKWIAAAVDHGGVSLVQNNISSGGGLSPSPLWAQGPTVFILWIAFAADGSGFAAAGGDGNVYYFDVSAYVPGSNLQPAWYTALAGCKTCRAVAVSDDGSLVSAVGDVREEKGKGKVFLFSNQGNSSTQKWDAGASHSTNSTSMDSAGQYVTVADGYGPAGDFTLYKAAGTPALWTHATKATTWPMQISADGSAIAAGSNDGYLYYFPVP
jgi:WD40 repeat protein